ncbi:MAG: nitrile hydratase accessory protein [Alphaproteobacteria bacterium]
MTEPILAPELSTLVPNVPRNEAGPVFDEPWQAQAFAMAVALHGQGHFTWGEWAQCLGAALKAADPTDQTGQAGQTDQPQEAYYRAWLSALEQMSTQAGLVGGRELAQRKHAWDRAARATPHGEPIVLGREQQ